jgi:hypothetical protein
MPWTLAKTDSSLEITDGVTLKKVSNTGTHTKAVGDVPAGSGVRSFEVVVTTMGDVGIGLAGSDEPIENSDLGTNPNTSACLWHNGWTVHEDFVWRQGQGFAINQPVRISYEEATGIATWSVDGTIVLQRTLNFGPDVFPAVTLHDINDALTADFSPVGATAWEEDAVVVEPPPPVDPPPPVVDPPPVIEPPPSPVYATPNVYPNYLDFQSVKELTEIPQNCPRLQTTCFDLNRDTRRGGATYTRMLTPPPLNYRDRRGFIHVENDVNGGPQNDPDVAKRGSWWMLALESDGNTLAQLGGQRTQWGDFTSTARAVNQKAFEDFQFMQAASADFFKLRTEPGWHPFLHAVSCQKRPAWIYGGHTPRDYANGPIWAFPLGEDFVHTHYVDIRGFRTTELEWVPPEERDMYANNGNGTIIEGMVFLGESIFTQDFRPIVDGIVCTTKTFIRNNYIAGAARHGAYVITSMSPEIDNPKAIGNGYPGGNANESEVSGNIIQNNGGWGLKLLGMNSNCVKVEHNEFNQNGFGGWCNMPFLGPTMITGVNHCYDNSIGALSTYTHGYLGQQKPGCQVWFDHGPADGGIKTYLLQPPTSFDRAPQVWQDAIAKQPGTDDNVWVWYFDGQGTFSKEWLPDQEIGTYTFGGASLTAGDNLWTADIGSYDEGDQSPAGFFCARGIRLAALDASFTFPGSYGGLIQSWGKLITEIVQDKVVSIDGKRINIEHSTLSMGPGDIPNLTRIRDSRYGPAPITRYENGHLAYGYETSSGGMPLTATIRVGENKAGKPAIVGGSGRPLPFFEKVESAVTVAATYPWGRYAKRRLAAHNIQGLTELDLQKNDVVEVIESLDPNNPSPWGTNEPGGFTHWVIAEDSPYGHSPKVWHGGLIEGTAVSWDVDGLGTLAPGASTSWQTKSFPDLGIGPSSHLHLSMHPAANLGLGQGRHRVEVSPQPGSTIEYRVTNLGDDPLNLSTARFYLKQL